MKSQELKWSPAFSVGVEYIDNHHRTLIGIVVDLRQAVNLNQSRVIIKQVLFELVSYTRYHFAAEERMMLLHGYNGYDRHYQEHRLLTKQVEDYLELYGMGDKELPARVLEFLKEWLMNHVLKSDKDLGRYLNTVGVH